MARAQALAVYDMLVSAQRDLQPAGAIAALVYPEGPYQSGFLN